MVDERPNGVQVPYIMEVMKKKKGKNKVCELSETYYSPVPNRKKEMGLNSISV